MSAVRRFAVGPADLTNGALDESGQEKRHCRGRSPTPAHGLRGRHRQRRQHRLPGLHPSRNRTCADRRPAVDPHRADRRPRHGDHHGATGRPGVRHQEGTGDRPAVRRLRRRRPPGFPDRRRGARRLHLPGAAPAGLRAARPRHLHPHPSAAMKAYLSLTAAPTQSMPTLFPGKRPSAAVPGSPVRVRADAPGRRNSASARLRHASGGRP